jgi:hypothetical protein
LDVNLRFADNAIKHYFDTLNAKIDLLTRKVNVMAGELDALQAQVAKNADVIDSAITLIKGIKAKLDECIASGNPAALQALSDALGAKDAELATAVAENTPSQP